MSLNFKAFAAAVVIGLSTLTSTEAATIRTGFDANTLPRNDDGSTGAVNVGFLLNFFGVSTNSIFVNNNGNVTFTQPLPTFTPFGLTGAVTQPIIAPFFADIDTRAAGSAVTYGAGSVGGRQAFGVNWQDVDYFGGSLSHTARNSIQLILIDRSDILAGAFDFEFNYGSIQWETGQASNGNANGLGGFSARVGWSNGTGTFFEQPGSGVNGAFLDGGSNQLITATNTLPANPGRLLFSVRNSVVEPVPTVPVPATLPLMLVGPVVLGAIARRRARKS
ncbi:VPLPA-CTERM sorting domain-containing protein [Rhodobacter sp. KR11]|uniref:nidogen-like domain-containing protein n=1 Tax=Rhodobacter sp. KR11 TaxID=2974588 RepID=UPI0022228566|nr:nidogen-like domain-containing protein [Rhodobacter sp. KR11]MCW1920507.1 VPLPA-CTERM sorting domain-containing protein [Rhodobacter sp. KR11]